MTEPEKEYFLDVDYHRGGPPFIELVEQLETNNSDLVGAEYSSEIQLLHQGMNTIYTMACEFAWLFNNQHIAILSHANTVLFSTLHKNLIALYTSLKLTRVGLYGPARSMLRHAYEALLIAKFCAVSDNTSIYDKWKEGDIVYLSKGVLKRISHPDTEVFSEYWGLMSEYTHATIYAQQVELNVKAAPDEVPLNLVYLRTLLDCQYHLVNRHLITPSMIYYTKRYRRGHDPLPELRRTMRQLINESRSTLLPRPKELIRSYCANWSLC